MNVDVCVCVCYGVNTGLLLIMCLSRRITGCRRRNYICSASLLLLLSLIHTMLQCLKRIRKLFKKTPISGLHQSSLLIQPFSPGKARKCFYKRNLEVVNWSATAIYEWRLLTLVYALVQYLIYHRSLKSKLLHRVIHSIIYHAHGMGIKLCAVFDSLKDCGWRWSDMPEAAKTCSIFYTWKAFKTCMQCKQSIHTQPYASRSFSGGTLEQENVSCVTCLEVLFFTLQKVKN